ncbi:hypothetical protein QCD79_31260, partial [Pseudomonas quasicaspiana]|nr:hypothetical protein [Pseudomonas quasicaspiana]
DMAFMLPISVWFIVNGDASVVEQFPMLYLLIPVLGLTSAAALVRPSTGISRYSIGNCSTTDASPLTMNQTLIGNMNAMS